MGKTILITGGAGFIGSHVVRRMVKNHPGDVIINLDKLTYAGNLENLRSIEHEPNYRFVKGDILDADLLSALFRENDIHGVIHLAAESHVDRSLEDPVAFARTNVLGTIQLMTAARTAWKDDRSRRFYQVSTDEVYGCAKDGSLFTEQSPIDPRSPYSASKASADHFVSAWHNSFGFPTLISRCSNNYGPNHFPEKLIPLMINNIMRSKPLPVYGKGDNVRDWLYVEDHAKAIDLIFHEAAPGAVYNIGGNNEWRNIDLVRHLCKLMDQRLGKPEGTSEELIQFVADRPGHDLRYAIDSTRLKTDLGWEPSLDFAQGLEKTVDWYLANSEWLEHVTSGAYQTYYDRMYAGR